MFLGLVDAYRIFMPNLGELTVPIHILTMLSKVEFNNYMEKYTEMIISAMNIIKDIVTADPSLALPRPDINFIV
jgi:hypothetical protein